MSAKTCQLGDNCHRPAEYVEKRAPHGELSAPNAPALEEVPVSVIRALDPPTAVKWIAMAGRMGLRWDALGACGNGRLRSYRFTAPVNILFDFAQRVCL